MAEPEPGPSTSRRSTAAQRHRRHLRRRILGTIGVVVLVVLAALWFSDTLRIPTDGPSLANGAAPDKTPSAGVKRVAPTVVPTHRALNPLQPLRLWVGGDSLAGALGPSLGKMSGATGVVQPYYDSRISTGLISGNINWPQHATEQLAQVNPEVVVFMIGTNDAVVYNSSQAEEYAQKVDAMMRVLIGMGREVYWVNAPVLANQRDEKNVLEVNRIQREVSTRFPDNVTYVDAHTLFADERGQYQSSELDDNGKRVVMRASDGVHLTGAGGDHLAFTIFQLLDLRWKIRAQAVPGQTKKTIVARGSTQVPGSESSGSSSYRSYGSSSGYRSTGTTATSATTATTQSTATTQPTVGTTPTTTPTTPPPSGP